MSGNKERTPFLSDILTWLQEENIMKILDEEEFFERFENNEPSLEKVILTQRMERRPGIAIWSRHLYGTYRYSFYEAILAELPVLKKYLFPFKEYVYLACLLTSNKYVILAPLIFRGEDDEW